MRTLFTGTLAALVLSAAVANSQTPPAQPPAGQTPPSTAQPSGQTKPTEQTPPSSPQTADQKPAAGKGTTYRGYLRGSDASGWTFSPVADRMATAAPGATATAGATKPGATTYSVVVPAGTKADLATMADQCVEIVGTLGPENPASKTNRPLTVTTIRAAQGGCTQ